MSNEKIKEAAAEYQAAYSSLTKMNVPTPEGAGTFGGVWDCDPARLARALVLAVRRTIGSCARAAEMAARGETISVGMCEYGSMPVSGCDVYQTPNGRYREPSGRYLTEIEADLIRSAAEPANYWYEPGRMTQRFIDTVAGDQIARTLTKPYLSGWPVCTDQQKIDAYRRVAAIYRSLAEAYAEAKVCDMK